MFVALLLHLGISAASADGCDSVLLFTGRETLNSYQYNSDYKRYHDEACRQGFVDSTRGGSADLSVPTTAGVVTLGASRYQTQSQFDAMCTMNSGQTSSLEVNKSYLSAVNPAAVSAWEACKASSNGKINVNHGLDTTNLILVASFPDLLEGNTRRVATVTDGLDDCMLNDGVLSQNVEVSYSSGQTFRIVCRRAREEDQRHKSATITFAVDAVVRQITLPASPTVSVRKQVRIDTVPRLLLDRMTTGSA